MSTSEEQGWRSATSFPGSLLFTSQGAREGTWRGETLGTRLGAMVTALEECEQFGSGRDARIENSANNERPSRKPRITRLTAWWSRHSRFLYHLTYFNREKLTSQSVQGPPTSLSLVQILKSTPYLGRVCCWLPSFLRLFLSGQLSSFSPFI